MPRVNGVMLDLISPAKIQFGDVGALDTNLYRSAANRLQTDDSFWASGDMVANQGTAAQIWLHPGGGIYLHSSADTNLYRAYAKGLATNGSFLAADNIYVDTGGTAAKLYFGAAGDTNLYRLAAGALGVGGGLYVTSAPLGIGYSFGPASFNANWVAVQSAVFGENPRWSAMQDGKQWWGAGGATAVDTNLYRLAADQLKTDDSFYSAADIAANLGTMSQIWMTGGSILWGSPWDTNLFRFAADFLATHDNFGANISGTGQVTLQAPGGLPTIFFGNVQDTNLYRGGANLLRTDDSLITGTGWSVADWNITNNTGKYIGSSAANGPPTTSGYPYWLGDVISWQDGVHCTQLLSNLFVDEIWSRRLASGSWFPWVKISPVPDASLPTRVGPSGQDIEAGDCDLVTATGWYCTGPSTLHSPTASPYWMIRVERNGRGNPAYVRQTAYDYASDDIYMRRASGGAFTAWVKTYPAAGGGGGATPATTVAGLGTATDGKLGLLRVGSSPYDYLPVTYDATYGKWVSEEVRFTAGTQDANQVGQWNTNYGGHALGTVLRWKAFHDAGLRLQVKLLVSASSNHSVQGGSAAFVFKGANPGTTANANIPWVKLGTSPWGESTTSLNFSNASYGRQTKLFEWEPMRADMLTGTIYEYMNIGFQLSSSYPTTSIVFFEVTGWYRWVSV